MPTMPEDPVEKHGRAVYEHQVRDEALVAKLLANGLTQAEVDAIEAALPDAPPEEERPKGMTEQNFKSHARRQKLIEAINARAPGWPVYTPPGEW